MFSLLPLWLLVMPFKGAAAEGLILVISCTGITSGQADTPGWRLPLPLLMHDTRHSDYVVTLGRETLNCPSRDVTTSLF